MEQAQRRATLRDVADLAGVSIRTISRVINSSGPVAEPTAARVHQAIDTLGFRPNPAARSLRLGRDDAVGLVIENIADPFMAAMTAAVEERMRRHGVFVIVTSGGYDPENERAAVESLVHRRIAGMIITPTSSSHRYLRRERLTFPVVFVDRPPVQFEADTVLADNEGGARRAVEHLIAHGHRHIAFVSDRAQLFTTALRYQGYRTALAAAGIPVEAHLVRADVRGIPAAAAAVRELLTGQDPPTALFSANARTSIGAVGGLHAMGAARTAHISFDDLENAASLVPALTVVNQDPVHMGEEAADLLLGRMRDPGGPPRHVLLPTRLIVRGSGELPP